MSYNQAIPNASQSPGLFPPQSVANFTRLKTIINADHVFNNAAQATDGLHRQTTLINRAQPGALPAGASSIAYSWLDANNQAQLRFYNGVQDFQLTPILDEFPIRVVGMASLAPATTAVAYADPGFTWVGTGWAIQQATSTFRFYNICRSGSNDIHEQDNNNQGVDRLPNLEFSGNNLLIRNNNPNGSGNKNYSWSLIINKLP